MKCPKCRNIMDRVDAGNNVFYFACPHCGTTVGMPETLMSSDKAPTIAQGEEDERNDKPV